MGCHLLTLSQHSNAAASGKSVKPVCSGAFKSTLRHAEIYVEHQPRLLEIILYTNIFKIHFFKGAIIAVLCSEGVICLKQNTGLKINIGIFKSKGLGTRVH